VHRPAASLTLAAAVLALSAAAAPAAAGTPTAIYTTIPGHPTAEAPGLGVDFTSLLDLNGSPGGGHWIFKAFVDPAIDIVVVGSGGSGSVVAREGDPSPIAGRVYSFMDSECGINDSGRYAFGARLNAPTTDDEVIFTFDGASLVTAVREGDPAPGLTDPSGAGNELFGNSLNSTHVLADGTVGFRADLIQNIDSDFESALYLGSVVVAQEGTLGSPGVFYDSFAALGGNTFTGSPDGTSWIVEADLDPDVIDNLETVVLRGDALVGDGDLLPGATLEVDAVFGVEMTGSGDWLARGDLTDDSDWAVRNGAVVALTGDPVVPGSAETWGDAIAALGGNNRGEWVIGGNTQLGDPALDGVVVLYGLGDPRVVMREGDPVDLDGDGVGDGVEIDSFSPNDLVLGDDLTLSAFVDLRDAGTGGAMGDAFVALALPIFADGFESGDTTAWTGSVGL
jgi:hypothetical protein